MSPTDEQVQVNGVVDVPGSGEPLNGPLTVNAADVQLVVGPEHDTPVFPTLPQFEQVPLVVQDDTVLVEPFDQPTAEQSVCELDSKPVSPTFTQPLQVPLVWFVL